ncbi:MULTISPECIES: helix-turn-helix transcriptional regulator [Streptomyces]|uniref:XRE family transcriptional regulator n=1 Tax=Streptomyces tsukubensis (strain DSM 42081 / NBRC 108919 / NRRL 18488 / 9993) TaxID=1114943 RepID=A0A7G3UAW7_STRT9|nr:MULTISPECIES: helix-turn-helix transcriptional regulator [Streptomyces]AZK97879.1 transcriptional regulator [Streptomyces tsukubensis]MYS67251.1 helix-turn-helix domain-containing protein [Streptomyces sp. SID5473]QKM66192.1 XRE family transcriptional regulator [Streptomyces tsukubensis NRRL18488]TAI45470.1 XRE family transcriptional regulator [Streptomyces tsukubensis]
MSHGSPLGDFLRARREALKPHDVGLPEHGRRRVPGLRREEVAMLAGVSSDYYIRLEQGRENSPSPQVLGAVAQALKLDAEAADHLNRLCRTASQRPRDRGETDVSRELLQLMDGWAHTPAFVIGPALDIMAGNSLATALHSGFDAFDNLARMVFADPAGREFYQEWERAAHSCVAELRSAYGYHPASARIAEVVTELSDRSEEFAAIWRLHDVKSKSQEGKHLKHPRVGHLHISFAAFTVNGAPHQQLVVYQAEPSSPTAAAFDRLRAMATRPSTRTTA